MQSSQRSVASLIKSLTLALVLIAMPVVGLAQKDSSGEDAAKILINALALFKAERYVEASPYFEMIVKAVPNDPDMRFMYGWTLVVRSKQTPDVKEAKKLSAEALVQMQEAKRLGLKDPDIDQIIVLLGGSSGEPKPPRIQTEAEKVLDQAEIEFTRSNYDEAIVLYLKALALDPKLYDAAVHAGDAYVAKQDWANAEKLYQKAIEIDPTRERAYRYSATPLMRQKKYNEARDRYIEAFITEPYGGMSIRGINQWAEVTGAELGHPKIAIPDFEIKEGKPVTTIDPKSVAEGSKAWLAYSVSRESWRNERFATAFPKAAAYRHSLQEELESIRAALASAKTQGLKHRDLTLLQKLDDDGVLESFILLARTDDGIAEDYPDYLKANRPKLRAYVLNYVISK